MKYHHRDMMNPFHDVSFEFPDLLPNWGWVAGLIHALVNRIKLFLSRLKLMATRLGKRLRESWAETEEVHRRMREAHVRHSRQYNLFYLR